jgi:hypothetical protein
MPSWHAPLSRNAHVAGMVMHYLISLGTQKYIFKVTIDVVLLQSIVFKCMYLVCTYVSGVLKWFASYICFLI